MLGSVRTLIVRVCALQMAFVGRGPGGPKPRLWTQKAGQSIQSFFARRSEAQQLLEWKYLLDGDDMHQARVPIGSRVKHTLLGVSGAVLRKGSLSLIHI